MNTKIFPLLLLVSTPSAVWAKNTPSHKELPAEKQPSIGEVFDEMEKAFRASSLDMMKAMQEGLSQLQTELNQVTTELKKDTSKRYQHNLVEENEQLKISFKLPEGMEYQQDAELEIINENIVSLHLKDSSHTVSIGATYDTKTRTIMGQIVTTSEQKEGESRILKNQSSFKHPVAGTIVFSKLSASYDPEQNTLTLTIPKDFSVEKTRKVKVAIKE